MLVVILFLELSHTQWDIVETARIVCFSGKIFPLASYTTCSLLLSYV